jgi:hypothetical protein
MSELALAVVRIESETAAAAGLKRQPPSLDILERDQCVRRRVMAVRITSQIAWKICMARWVSRVGMMRGSPQGAVDEFRPTGGCPRLRRGPSAHLMSSELRQAESILGVDDQQRERARSSCAGRMPCTLRHCSARTARPYGTRQPNPRALDRNAAEGEVRAGSWLSPVAMLVGALWRGRNYPIYHRREVCCNNVWDEPGANVNVPEQSSALLNDLYQLTMLQAYRAG